MTLIPSHWIEALPDTLWGNLGLVLIAIVALAIVIRGADWLVEGAAGLAHRMGMSKVVVGATILSLGTTSPEAAVSVMAAWGGSPGLALGNGVGSIIANTGLIFAIGCLWMRLPADPFVLKRQGMVKVGVAIALAVICYAIYAWYGDALLRDAAGDPVINGRGNPVPMARIGQWIGLALVAALIVYLATSVHWARRHAQLMRQHAAAAVDSAAVAGSDAGVQLDAHLREGRSVLVLVAMGVAGLALVIVAGDGLVQSVSVATRRWGVPEVVVAGTLVALGTSLPELMVAITSLRKGYAELMVGNVIGADVLNVLFVIGAAAVASPLAIIEPGTPAPRVFLELHLPVLLAMTLLMGAGMFGAMRTGTFSRWLGAPLLGLYVVFLVTVIVRGTGY